MGWSNNSIFTLLVVTGGSGSGVFVYSPSPGAGNLVASVTTADGTDRYGNAVLGGIAQYTSPGGGFLAVAMRGGAYAQFTAPTEAGPWTLRGTLQILSPASPDIFLQAATGSLLLQAPAAGKVIALQRTSTIQDTSTGTVPILDVTNQGSSSAPITRVTAAAVGDLWWGGRVSGDTNARAVLDTASPGGNPRLRFGPGNAAPDATLTRINANQLQLTAADLDIATLGRGLQVAEGANARMGLATLVAGTVTVANTTITGSTRIFLTEQSAGGTQGILRIAARTIGTSFTITSTNAADTSTVAWLLVEPG